MLVPILLLLAIAPQVTTADAPTWILTRNEVSKNEVLEAWLLLPHQEASSSIETSKGVAKPPTVSKIDLVAPSHVKAWFAIAGHCEILGSPSWTGIPPESGLIKVCARPEEDRAFALLAITRQAEASRVTPSEQVLIKSTWKVDPAMLGVITTVVGFLTGLVGYVGQKFFDRWLVLRDTARSIVKTVTEMLVKEIVENRDELVRYIEGKVLDPPILSMGNYVALLGDEGAMSFLGGEERRKYFAKVEKLYSAIGEYNDAVNLLAVDPSEKGKVLERAKELKSRMSKIAS